jgi:hypothetical protein
VKIFKDETKVKFLDEKQYEDINLDILSMMKISTNLILNTSLLYKKLLK